MCAQAYFLLGYLKDATGDKEAADYYRRALYLQPDHHESLLRMAGLAARLGQPDRALAYQRRARKAKQRVPLKS